MTVRFSNKLVAELFQPFWAALQAGDFLTDAAAVADVRANRARYETRSLLRSSTIAVRSPEASSGRASNRSTTTSS